MIPRRFFWVFDSLVVGIAFVAAHALTRFLQPFLAPGGRLSPLFEYLPFPPPATGSLTPADSMLWILIAMIASTVIGMEVLGGYQPPTRQGPIRVIASAVMASFVGIGFIALALLALRRDRESRLFILLLAAITTVTLSAYRLAIRWYYRRRMAAGYHRRNVALMGMPASLNQLLNYLGPHLHSCEFQVVGYLKPSEQHPMGGTRDRLVVDLPFLGDVRDLSSLLVHQPIHEVIAIQPATGGDWLKQTIEDCAYFRVTVRIVPGALLDDSIRNLRLMFHADPLALPEVVLKPPNLDSDRLFLKRLMDVVLSTILLGILAPIFGIIGLAIKLTTPRLPVFYRWRVIGYQGHPFVGYKFTTMVHDADERRGALQQQNEMDGPVFKIKADPRVTPLGSVLRKYSLNELPQLWSVLKGDMSLVGPRPAFRHELERYELWHKRKLCVRPGITCLWQVSGRNRIRNFDEWVRMDLEYIDTWSLWLDVKILVRTAWAVVAGTGW